MKSTFSKFVIFTIPLLALLFSAESKADAHAHRNGCKYIKTIKLYYGGVVFDSFWTREKVAEFSTEEHIWLTEKSDIERFVYSIDTLKSTGYSYVSPYSAQTLFFSSPFAIDIQDIARPTQYAEGMATIFYSNGKLPDTMWIGSTIEFNGRKLNMTLDVIHYLQDLMRRDDKGHFDTSRLYSDSVEVSGVEKVEIIGFNGSAYMSRRDFCHQLISNPTHFYLSEINVWRDLASLMEGFKSLKYKKTLPYNTEDPATTSHYNAAGDLVWESSASPVKYLIRIYYTGQSEPEMIWITENFVERGYFQFDYEPKFKRLIYNLLYPL